MTGTSAYYAVGGVGSRFGGGTASSGCGYNNCGGGGPYQQSGQPGLVIIKYPHPGGCPGFTPTITRTNTQTITQTPTNTRTTTQTPTQTSTQTPTQTVTRTRSQTPTFTFTRTQTPTNTRTRTQTPTQSQTYTQTPTVTQTTTTTNTQTPTLTRTPTQTTSISVTPTNTATQTRTPTNTATQTRTRTQTRTSSQTSTNTYTPTVTQTSTRTQTQTPGIVTADLVASQDASDSNTNYVITPTPSVTTTFTGTCSPVVSNCLALSLEANNTLSYPASGGSVWYDMVNGYGFSGTFPSYTSTDPVYMNFAGDDITISESDTNSIVNLSAGTVEGWIKWDTVSSDRVVLSYGGNSNDQGFLLLSQNSSSNKIGF